MDRDLTASTCPGYSTALPAVQEVVAAYCHWESGTLTEHVGDVPSPTGLDMLAVLRAGINEHTADKSAESSRRMAGGG